MDILLVSVDHNLQLVEAETDSSKLRTQKIALRELLQAHLIKQRIAEIFEESSQGKITIAYQLASQNDPVIPWHNIVMTEDERKAVGIFDALKNRPGYPDFDEMQDGMPTWIERRIPADAIREDFFTNQILEANPIDGKVLVLLGDMHVMPVAEKLTASGHTVDIRDDLIPIKRWK